MNNVFYVQKEINPVFKPVWQTRKPYIILKGGRNSFKSSVITLKLVRMLIEYISIRSKANVVVLRKTATTIRDSIYSKIQWALQKYGFRIDGTHFKATVSPFRITHIDTGSSFYFYGQDDFEKLKSNDINDIIAVWYEEASEFNSAEEFDQTNITFMRQKHKLAANVQFYWSYNPPRNPYSWINEWAEKMQYEDDYLVHHSTYKDDELGFTTEQMLKDIERVKQNDRDYYLYIYEGFPVGIGDNVYNIDLFHKVAEIPGDERITKLYLSTDTGYSVSATVTCAFALTNKQNIYLLDTDYYSPENKKNKRGAEEHSRALRKFEKKIVDKYNRPISKKTVDSADGAIRNQYFNMYGENLHPVTKGKKVDLIDNVIDLLAQGRFFYIDIPANEIFIEQHKKYRWNEKSIETNPDNPGVVKTDDHTCDSFQYFVKDNLRDLNLKF